VTAPESSGENVVTYFRIMTNDNMSHSAWGKSDSWRLSIGRQNPCDNLLRNIIDPALPAASLRPPDMGGKLSRRLGRSPQSAPLAAGRACGNLRGSGKGSEAGSASRAPGSGRNRAGGTGRSFGELISVGHG
jgi:hypothetical protein